MRAKTLGAYLALAFREGISVGADTTWDSHVRVWIGALDHREHVDDFGIEVADDLIAWLAARVTPGDAVEQAEEVAEHWSQLWSSMQALFEQEIDSGFQTHPGDQEITAWIGNEYYGHLTERTFNIDELERNAVRNWLADEASGVFRQPAHSRPAQRASSYR